jgi:hypothetical protein
VAAPLSVKQLRQLDQWIIIEDVSDVVALVAELFVDPVAADTLHSYFPHFPPFAP